MSAENIRPLTAEHLPEYAEVIRKSFATVAADFNFMRENCPSHTSFITNEQLAEKIDNSYYPFGYFSDEKLVGFVSLEDRDKGVFKLKNLAILPEYRHLGYGKLLLDFCKEKVKELDGNKITIGIIEECTILKNWYTANGFTHTGTTTIENLPFTVGYMEWRHK